MTALPSCLIINRLDEVSSQEDNTRSARVHSSELCVLPTSPLVEAHYESSQSDLPERLDSRIPTDSTEAMLAARRARLLHTYKVRSPVATETAFVSSITDCYMRVRPSQIDYPNDLPSRQCTRHTTSTNYLAISFVIRGIARRQGKNTGKTGYTSVTSSR